MWLGVRHLSSPKTLESEGQLAFNVHQPTRLLDHKMLGTNSPFEKPDTCEDIV
jgi:hypothetical protein